MRGLEVAVKSQNSLTFRRLAADVARQRTPMLVGRKEAQERRNCYRREVCVCEPHCIALHLSQQSSSRIGEHVWHLMRALV